MLSNQTHLTNIETPVRQIQAKAELYNGSALIDAFYYTDDLKSFDVERVGEEKFFGFGFCQKANIKVLDVTREKDITTANSFKIYLGAEGDYFSPYPTFTVTEVHRDENTNQLSITAYDLINEANKHTVSELTFTSTLEDETTETTNSYTIKEFTEKCATLIGASALSIINVGDTVFDTVYNGGANFDGTETIREALTAVAEATQTIFYINKDDALVFKRLDVSGDAVMTIDKSKYIELESKTNRRLSSICHATELGDNVSAAMTETGTTQYVRNNPFWDMREDIATLVENALAAVGGLTINQFDCNWRGNYLLEIGDKFHITTKDDNTVTSYLLDDVTSYDGTFSQETRWSYTDSEETASNATTLGDALKQTYARVDKANKQIDLVASEASGNSDKIAALEISTESINASVQSLEKGNGEAFDSINGEIEELTKKVNASISSEEVKLEIQTQLSNGVSKVETNTGFTFDDEGLTVEKSGSEMKTQITEDGMTVYKNNEAVLTANNVGVNAVNLHATTYLIIGTNSRFEDYGDSRTGCFWIGN